MALLAANQCSFVSLQQDSLLTSYLVTLTANMYQSITSRKFSVTKYIAHYLKIP